jgi:hypothetical protein
VTEYAEELRMCLQTQSQTDHGRGIPEPNIPPIHFGPILSGLWLPTRSLVHRVSLTQ